MTITDIEDPVAPDLVYGLALSPAFASDGTAFAARKSGLYRSDDGGQTWRSMYDTLQLDLPLTTSAVAVSPNFAYDSLVLVGVKGGILRTHNNGRNWRVMLFPPPAPLITTIVMSPSFEQDGVALAGTVEDGIFCSTDRGMQWAAWNFGLLDWSVYSLALSPNFIQNQTVYAGTENGIFRSTNGGRSWRQVPFPSDAAPVTSLAVLEDSGLLAGTEANGLFFSADGGQTWKRQSEMTIPGVVNAILPQFPGQTDITILLDTSILSSADGEPTWRVWADLEQSATAIAGSAATGALLVGMVEGQILRLLDRLKE